VISYDCLAASYDWLRQVCFMEHFMADSILRENSKTFSKDIVLLFTLFL
jgi:hypothetical protein